ncbi:MAG: hypothetical protein KAS32_31415 [Candidatus Peribacteraceae bacterium]|nr:hypothetical protein [Candidatus Peribacteraceae bacterium]
MGKELTKEEQSEIIGAGIFIGYTKIMFCILLSLVSLIVLIIGNTMISDYLFPYNTDSIEVAVSDSYYSSLKHLDCYVTVSNDTFETDMFYFDIRGASEATAYYELKRPEYEDIIKSYNLSYELKGVYCN